MFNTFEKKKTKPESKSTFAKIKNQNGRYPWQHAPIKAKWYKCIAKKEKGTC